MQSWRNTLKSWCKVLQKKHSFRVISKDQNISSSIKIKKLQGKKINGTIVFKRICFEETKREVKTMSQLRHSHIVQLNHYIERHTIEMILKISGEKTDIMFQTAYVNHVLDVTSHHRDDSQNFRRRKNRDNVPNGRRKVATL